MRPPYSHIPALPVAIGLCAGIFVGFYLSGLWPYLLTGVLAISAIAYYRHRHMIGTVAACTSLGIILAIVSSPTEVPADILDRQCVITGQFESVTNNEGSASGIFDVESISITDISRDKIKIYLTISNSDRKYQSGDRLKVTTSLTSPSQRGTIPDQTDYSRYRYINGATANAYAYQSDITYLGYDPSFIQRIANRGHISISDAIVHCGLNDKTTAFLLAVIAGDDYLLGENISNNFRSAGIAHILAISGMHLAILIWLMSMVIAPIKLIHRGRHAYYILLILFTWYYTLISGMSPAVSRAAVMATIFLLSRIVERHAHPYNSLCITVITWLIINPLWAFMPGFQLSVIAVAAIIYLSDLIKRYELSPKASMLAQALVIPIGVMIAVTPLTVIYFHQFPVWFLPANILASILIWPIVVLGFILTIFASLGMTVPILADVENLIYGLLDHSVDLFASLPALSGQSLYPPTYLWLLYLGAVIAAVIALNRRRLPMAVVSGIYLAGFLILSLTDRHHDSNRLYIPGDTSDGAIIMYSPGHAVLISSLSPADTADFHLRAHARYRDFLARHNLNCFLTPQGDFKYGGIARQGDIMFVQDILIRIITDSTATNTDIPTDYALITRHFHGDIAQLVNTIHADTFLLGSDINSRRRDRYIKQLSEFNIPSRSIRHNTFALNPSSSQGQ